MLFSLVKFVFKWILKEWFGYEFLGPQSKNLTKRAQKDIIEKLSEIHNRKDQYEVDAKTTDISKYPVYFLESTYSSDYIKINDNDVIQEEPEFIVGGFWRKQKTVAVKWNGLDENITKREMRIADQLKNCHHFLQHFFNSKQSQNIIVTEYYSTTLKTYIDRGSHLRSKMNVGHTREVFSILNHRKLLTQLGKGLDFMHDRRIAHKYLNTRNVAVVEDCEKLIFKITNFRFAVEDACNDDFRCDVKSLGEILEYSFREKRKILNSKYLHEDLLCVALIDEMTKPDYRKRLSIKEVLCHPFLWTPKETLHFIVQTAKIFESSDFKIFESILRRFSHLIFDKDWRADVDRYLLNELRVINRDNLPYPTIVGLVKTIRNLHVHYPTKIIVRAMGSDEESMLKYWTDHFPHLILHLFNAVNEYERK